MNGTQQTAVLVVVAGQAGAGKARFARILAARTGARLIESVSGGPLRAGVDPAALPDKGEYATLLQTARMSLESGESIVLAAPFQTVASRKALVKLSGEVRCALLFVECSADDVVRRRRLQLRYRDEGLADVERHLDEVIAAGSDFESVGREIPRSCQMLLDTTVGIELWAGLAAGRVESFLAAEPGRRTEADAQAISAG